MEKNQIKQNLLNARLELNNTSCSIYLFGSALYKEHYRDIDILILYAEYKDLEIAKYTIESLLPENILHFTCLTREEEEELGFIKTTNASKIE